MLECPAVSYGKAMSYLPVINLLQSYFEIADQDNPQAISDKVEAKLLALDRHSRQHCRPCWPSSMYRSRIPPGRHSTRLSVGDACWTACGTCCCGKHNSGHCC